MKELDIIKFFGKSVKNLNDLKEVFLYYMSKIEKDSRYPIKLYLETTDGPLKYKKTSTKNGEKYLIPSDSITDKDRGYLIDVIIYDDIRIINAIITVGRAKAGQYSSHYDAFMNMDDEHREYHIYVSEQFGVTKFDNEEVTNKHMEFIF